MTKEVSPFFIRLIFEKQIYMLLTNDRACLAQGCSLAACFSNRLARGGVEPDGVAFPRHHFINS